MYVLKQSAEIVSPFDLEYVLPHLERCGRTCYKSDNNDASKFISKIVKMGHESVIEHFSVSVRIICNRAISHQLVRHRMASFSQESQRYVNYSKDKFGKGITYIEPIKLNTDQLKLWKFNAIQNELAYFNMIELGCSPQQAREGLSNATKTEMVITANLREWKHIFEQRTKGGADPMMKDLMIPLLEQFQEILPEVFGEKEG